MLYREQIVGIVLIVVFLFLIVHMFIMGLCLCTPCAHRGNKFCMVLRVVLYISMLVVHGLRRSMRFGTSLVETVCIHI